MIDQPLRRSKRARKSVDSYAEEQMISNDTCRVANDKEGADSFNQSEIPHEAIVIKSEHDEVSCCLVKTEESVVTVKSEPPVEDGVGTIEAELPVKHQAHDSDLDDAKQPSKKKRRAKKEDDPAVQLYGYPPAGTWIPWGVTRMRKQPKIYPVAEKKYVDMSHVVAAEQRIIRTKAKIPRLKLGEEETRLREYVVIATSLTNGRFYH
jgi:hypothetical protein